MKKHLLQQIRCLQCLWELAKNMEFFSEAVCFYKLVKAKSGRHSSREHNLLLKYRFPNVIYCYRSFLVTSLVSNASHLARFVREDGSHKAGNMTTNRVEQPWHQRLAITGRQRQVYQTIYTEDLHIMITSQGESPCACADPGLWDELPQRTHLLGLGPYLNSSHKDGVQSSSFPKFLSTTTISFHHRTGCDCRTCVPDQISRYIWCTPGIRLIQSIHFLEIPSTSIPVVA